MLYRKVITQCLFSSDHTYLVIRLGSFSKEFQKILVSFLKTNFGFWIVEESIIFLTVFFPHTCIIFIQS